MSDWSSRIKCRNRQLVVGTHKLLSLIISFHVRMTVDRICGVHIVSISPDYRMPISSKYLFRSEERLQPAGGHDL